MERRKIRLMSPFRRWLITIISSRSLLMMRSVHVVANVTVCEMPRHYEVYIELKGSEAIGLHLGVS